jgi:tetratricopeptide (TPR) repeat protein
MRKVAQAYERQGQYDAALRYLSRGRTALSGDDDGRYSVEMARICYLSGWVRMRLGEVDTAITDCEMGLAILAGLESSTEALCAEADLYNTLGTVYLDQGNHSRAADVYRRSAELREQAGDFPGMARSYNNLARAAWRQGDLRLAGEYIERMLEISKQIGNDYFRAFGYNNLGVIAFTTGDPERALGYYRDALALQRRLGDGFGVAQSYSNIGEALIRLGRHAEARQQLEQAANAFEAIQSEGELPEVYCLLAEVELVECNPPVALEYAERARHIAATTGNPEWEGIASRWIARSQVQTGCSAQAGAAFEASVERLAELESKVELAQSCYEYACFLLDHGQDTEQACENLRRAADLYASAGQEDGAAHAREALAQAQGAEDAKGG